MGSLGFLALIDASNPELATSFNTGAAKTTSGDSYYSGDVRQIKYAFHFSILLVSGDYSPLKLPVKRVNALYRLPDAVIRYDPLNSLTSSYIPIP